ncbi:hypothetical protein B0H16DRAFT_1464930 [Mycena metata]|uniref:Uncharacterized protein n=1 Tax=Mycena metata TaxID=1033252 RepID=A0AAD7IDK8_9AGAR|nr:hypothetical protein B0H16DRAFT_1464930 [Mycena metata]
MTQLGACSLGLPLLGLLKVMIIDYLRFLPVRGAEAVDNDWSAVVEKKRRCASPWYTVQHFTVLDFSKPHSLHNSRALLWHTPGVVLHLHIPFGSASRKPYCVQRKAETGLNIDVHGVSLDHPSLRGHHSALDSDGLPRIYRICVHVDHIGGRTIFQQSRNLAMHAAVIQDAFLELSYVIGDSMICGPKNTVKDLSVFTLTTFTVDLTLSTNVYCRSFIEWKIWTITQLALPSGGKKLRHFLVVVESAALYALWAVLFLVAFETQSNLQVVLIQAGPEPIRLVNALIMMCAGLGWTTEQIEGTASANPSVLVFSDFQ